MKKNIIKLITSLQNRENFNTHFSLDISMNYIEQPVLHEPCHRTLKPMKEILIETPKSPELSPNHTPNVREIHKNDIFETNKLKSPPLSDELKSLISPIPTCKKNKILFTIPPRVKNRLFTKKPLQQLSASPIIDKEFAESLKKVNSKTSQLDLTIDELESNTSSKQITQSKFSSSTSSTSIEESNAYEDTKEIEEITTPPSSQIESTHTSPNTITITNTSPSKNTNNDSPMKYRVYSTISSTINTINDDDVGCVLSPLHSLNSSPNTIKSPSSTYPTIIPINKSFQECMNSNTVSPLPMNDIDYNSNTNNITDSPPPVKRSVRIMNNPEIYDDDENFEKRRRIEKRVLTSNVEFELSINTSVYNNKYEIVNYPTLSIVQDYSLTKTSSFNKFLMGKRSKSILKMYGQNEYNIA